MVFVIQKRKKHDVHKQLQKTNERWKGQKNQGKPNGLNFPKSGVVTYKMWENRGAHKQLHENKTTSKAKKNGKEKLVKVMCNRHQNTSFIEVQM